MANNKKTTFKEIWDTLRGVDTSKIEQPLPQNSNLTYISWADAWVCIMDYYPELTYESIPPAFYGVQGETTCEVHCKIIIGEFSREMSLPVMTTMMPMKSITNPTSRDINDAKQRWLVKTLAMFGFGIHLWEKKKGSSVKITKHEDGVGF